MSTTEFLPRLANPIVEGVDFAVPTHYGIGERFPTWAEAVARAHSTIERFDYPGQGRDPAYSRAFVHMRQVEPVQEQPAGPASGSDGVVMSWEVFHDGTVRASTPREVFPLLHSHELNECDAEHPTRHLVRLPHVYDRLVVWARSNDHAVEIAEEAVAR